MLIAIKLYFSCKLMFSQVWPASIIKAISGLFLMSIYSNLLKFCNNQVNSHHWILRFWIEQSQIQNQSPK